MTPVDSDNIYNLIHRPTPTRAIYRNTLKSTTDKLKWNFKYCLSNSQEDKKIKQRVKTEIAHRK